MTSDNRKGSTCHHTSCDDQEYRLNKSAHRCRKACNALFALLTVLAAAIIAFCVWAYFYDR